MSEEKETKLKVKDLPESERNELLKEMEAAGLRGVKTEYQVETAKAKIEEWKKSQNAETNEQTGENDGQQTTSENSGGNEQNVGDGEQKTGNGEQTGENVSKTTENVNKTTKNVKKPAKKLICHICYGEVKNGVCTKCGFTLKRA